MSNKILIRIDQFSREDLGAQLDRLTQIRLVAKIDAEIAIAKKVFELVGHRENHRILRQTARKHDRGSEMVADESAAQVPETIRPRIDHDAVLVVNTPQIAREHSW